MVSSSRSRWIDFAILGAATVRAMIRRASMNMTATRMYPSSEGLEPRRIEVVVFILSPQLVGCERQDLGVVVAQVGHLHAAGLNVSYLVAVIHDFAAPGHKYVIPVRKEGLDRLVVGHGIAKVL